MSSIFVGNLSYDTTEADLRQAFVRYGFVSRVDLATDQSSGRFRGFAFVRMPSSEDAEEAIARLNGFQIRGRSVVVNAAKERAPQAVVERLASRWHLVDPDYVPAESSIESSKPR